MVAVTDASGTAVGTNTYDEYGIPAANNLGRFQYTGQIWVPEIGLYYYKARMYSPTYGRFMQTDPIGYGDGVNMYGYVGADPVNRKDPNGLACTTNDLYEDLYKGFSDGHLEYLGSNWIGSWVSGCEQVERGSGRSQEGGGGGGAGRANARPVPQRTQTPTPCQKAFLKDQLGSRGLPTSQIDNLKFVSGLDSNANALTRSAFNGGAGAVTQGSTVYVQPGGFDTVANFRSATGFEEAYHTAQFASNRGFYTTYGLLSLGGLLSTGDSYNGNLYEAFAKGASKQMFEASKAGMCPR